MPHVFCRGFVGVRFVVGLHYVLCVFLGRRGSALCPLCATEMLVSVVCCRGVVCCLSEHYVHCVL